MTTLIMFDPDPSADGITRRLREELTRRGIRSDSQAAKRYGKPQQWVSRHMSGDTDWKMQELRQFCDALGLDHIYAVSGIRTIHTTQSANLPVGYRTRTDLLRCRNGHRLVKRGGKHSGRSTLTGTTQQTHSHYAGGFRHA